MKVHDYLDFHARHRPEAPLANCDEKQITYGEARDESNRMARAFVAYGLQRGDRIAILARNSIELLLLYFGALKAGVVLTPINHRLMPSDWLHISGDAGAKLFFCDAQFTDRVETIRNQFDSLPAFVVTSGRPPSGWETMDHWFGGHVASEADSVNSDEEETTDQAAFQMYTSGTTGRPHGVLLTHGAVTANVAQLGVVAPFEADDRFLLVLPLFHAAGIIAMLHAVSWGASLILHRSFRPMEVVKALDDASVTITMMVPTMIRACLEEDPSITHRRFENLRLVIYGASAIDEETLRQAMRVFGCDFAQRYGTTETLSLTWLSPADHRHALKCRPELLRSAGRPLPDTEIRVIDEHGNPVSSFSEKGELVVRGPQLTRKSSKSGLPIDVDSPDAWIRTGDVGLMDNDGYVYLCDRVQDVIVSGGENVYPHEIEAALMKHCDVVEAAVIGVPDKKWGEAIKAVVVMCDVNGSSANELIEHCRQHLAGFKVPRSIEFVARLPRNSAGKVLRRKLREPY